MARPAKNLRITLEAIRCTNVGTDPGPTLEIYGVLDARGVFINGQGDPQIGAQKVLWNVGVDQAVNIGKDTEIAVNQSASFPVFQRDFLWIGGRMRDQDTFGADDTLGDGHRKMNYDELSSQIVSVGFNPHDESNQEVVARYRIEVLSIDPHPELN